MRRESSHDIKSSHEDVHHGVIGFQRSKALYRLCRGGFWHVRHCVVGVVKSVKLWPVGYVVVIVVDGCQVCEFSDQDFVQELSCWDATKKILCVKKRSHTLTKPFRQQAPWTNMNRQTTLRWMERLIVCL